MIITHPKNTGTIQEADYSSLLNYNNLINTGLIVRALNHKLRQKMIEVINEKVRITVTELFIILRLDQSVTSQHLAILRRAGLVSVEKEGKFVFYTVNHLMLQKVKKCIKELQEKY